MHNARRRNSVMGLVRACGGPVRFLMSGKRELLCRRMHRMLQQRHKGSSNNSGTAVSLQNAFKCFNLEEGPATEVTISREEALKLLTQMQEIRRLEMEAANLYKAKEIRGFCHLYIGQEAVACGMRAAMRKHDSLITSYRCHGWTYLMGIPNAELLAELMGFQSGSSRGKGGSMHLYAPQFYGGNGIVGAQVPLGTGVGLAHKYRGDGGVCFTLYGDGAANQGQVFESYNICCLKKLPVIYVCENNVYGMGTKSDRSSCCADYYTRGHYVPGLWVDGNNVLAVLSATKFAIDYCLKYGPIVLEMYTYRYVGHSMSDPGTSYRSREEVADVRTKRDPITSFQKQLIDMELVEEKEVSDIQKKVRELVAQDIKKAKASKEVELKELTADVYAKNLEPKIRNTITYNLEHIAVKKFTESAPKPTPKDEMKNVPIGDAAMAAGAAAAAPKSNDKKDADKKADKKPDAKSVVKSDKKSDIKSETKSDEKSKVKSKQEKPNKEQKPKTEIKSNNKPDTKSEMKQDKKSDIESEVRTDTKSEMKQDKKSDIESKVRTDTKPNTKPEMVLSKKPEMKSESQHADANCEEASDEEAASEGDDCEPVLLDGCKPLVET